MAKDCIIDTPEIIELCNKRDDLYNQIHEISDKISELRKDALNMTGKFYSISYFGEDDPPNTFIYVHETWLSTDDYNHPAFILNCVYISGETSEYLDNNYFTWDMLKQIYIKCGDERELENELKQYKEITEDIFVANFNLMVQQTAGMHHKIMSKILKYR